MPPEWLPVFVAFVVGMIVGAILAVIAVDASRGGR
jgi:uncharacterized membrane-anchored protein YhcB (DUF1043 family)